MTSIHNFTSGSSVPFLSITKVKPKGLHFNMPHSKQWALNREVEDKEGRHFMEWREAGKGPTESEQWITAQIRMIPDIDFHSYVLNIINTLCSLSTEPPECVSHFRKDGFLIKWTKKEDSKITYIFTTVLGEYPYFFLLEYETPNANKYYSHSNEYLAGEYFDMLREAQIKDCDPNYS